MIFEILHIYVWNIDYKSCDQKKYAHARFGVPTLLVVLCNLSVKQDSLREEHVF